MGEWYNMIRIDYSKTGFTKKEIGKIASETTENYFIIPTYRVPEVLNKLSEISSNSGHPFAKLQLKNLEKRENLELAADLSLSEGSFRTVDSILIKGYEKFPKPFLKYYAGIKTRSVFNREKLIEQTARINSLGFASVTQPPEVLFRKDSTTVYLYLQKENHNHFDGILGFATDEETQKLQFNGFLDLQLNNNLNFGEEFLLNYKADGNEQVEFRTRLKIPFLFNTRFGIGGELRIFKRDSSFVTTNQRAKLTYRLLPTAVTHLGYRRSVSNYLLEEGIAGIPMEDFNSEFFTVGGNFIRTENHPFFPIKTEVDVELGFGNRKGESNTENQWTAETLIRHIFTLSPRSSFLAESNTAFLKSDSYLENELFKFGGINSIRGFEENSLDASFFSTLSTEYRYVLAENIFIHSIIDLGYFENPVFELNSRLNSLGFGMGINTKGSLFRIIFANGRSFGQKFDFSASKVHISVSSRF